MSENLPFHLIATDLDGTLLNPSHQVTSGTKAVFQQLVATYPYAVSVALASGRPHPDVRVLLDELDLPDYSGFIVTSNGARVHRLVRDTSGRKQLEKVYSATLKPEDVAYLLTLLPDGESDIAINLYQGEKWFCSLDWQSELQYFAKSGFRYDLFNARERLQDWKKWKKEKAPVGMNPLEDVAKVYFGTDETDRLHEMIEALRRNRPDLEIVYSSIYCAEITAPGVTKASGLAALMPILQEQWKQNVASTSCGDATPWGLQQIIAFGDGGNDEVMLRSVGKGCIMQNAPEDLKQRLPHLEVIGTNAEDGVAHKVSEVFHLK